MKGLFNSLFQDKITFWAFSISLLLIILEASYILFNYSHIPPFVPIYNKRPWGDTRLGTKPEIFVPIGITFALYIINLFICAAVHPKNPLLARLLAMTNFLLNLLCMIFVIKIISLIL